MSTEARAIPGFYFDIEKRKYFAIQPDHKLPPDAKHAFGNVVKQERANERLAQSSSKKQKTKLSSRQKKDNVDAPKAEPVSNDLISVARVDRLLHHHVAGLTLGRELGLRLPTATIVDATSLLSNRPSRSCTRFYGYNVLHPPPTEAIITAFPQPLLQQLLVFRTNGAYSMRWDNRLPAKDALHQGPSATYPWQTTSRLTWWPRNVPQVVYEVETESDGLFVRQFHIANHDFPRGSTGETKLWCQGLRFSGHHPPDVRVLEISPDGQTLASAHDTDLALTTIGSRMGVQVQEQRHEARAMSWLSDNVLAADDYRHVRLYDRRAIDQQAVLRFANNQQITGIKRLNEHQLLVSDNYTLKVFDARWPTRHKSTLQLRVRQELSQAMMDVNELGIVAIYGQQTIELLSTRTGKQLYCSQLLGSQRDNVIRDLKWWDDADGVPYVQICIGTSLHRIRFDVAE